MNTSNNICTTCPTEKNALKKDKTKVEVVWFKKDLRIIDHAPLYHACRSENPVLFLYVFEPKILEHPSFHRSHWTFLIESLDDLKMQLQQHGCELTIASGHICEVLSRIHTHHPMSKIHAHEETGHKVSFDRDLAVHEWCRSHGVSFIEYPQNGVIRRLKSRDGWSRMWAKRMNENILPSPIRPELCMPSLNVSYPPASQFKIPGQKRPEQQVGGRAQARDTLDSYLNERGRLYQSAMSSPVTAWEQCSRLSPYLSFGCLSIKEIHHAVISKQQEWRDRKPDKNDTSRKEWLASLRSFSGRLRWHCHFIQKLEDEPRIEYESIIKCYDTLRQDSDPSLLQSWLEAQTGYPMIDACMRALNESGWINFRMRAMLVSFAAYDLWQPWQNIAATLAPLFLDYEPGIHYSQIQMQSGTTGINTLRIYNPTKQCTDHDPEGVFIRRYLPELSHVPKEYLAEPWKMPGEVQKAANCIIGTDYPAPIVDHPTASKKAREEISKIRRMESTREEAKKVLQKHGSRKKNRPSKARSSAQ